MQVILHTLAHRAARRGTPASSRPPRFRGWGARLALWAALVLPGPGCTDPPAGDPANELILLVSPQEAAQLRGSVRQALARNRTRRCPRPVLWGPPVRGRPDPLLIDVAEGRGSLKACVAYVKQSPKALEQILAEGGARDRPGRSARGAARTAPFSDSAADSAVQRAAGGSSRFLAGLAKRCGSLPERIAKAVRFASVCSPYLPGRRALPDFSTLMSLYRAAAALAWHRAQREPAAAVRQLLRLLRFAQDLERGPTPWIWPYVLRSGWRSVVALLGRALAAERLPEGLPRTVDRALRTLLRSEPPLPIHLRGERLLVERRTFYRPLTKRAGARSQAPLRGGVQGHLLAWLAYRRQAQRLERGCPPQGSAWRCHRRLVELEAAAAASQAELSVRWAAFERWLARQRWGRAGGSGRFPRRRAQQAALRLLRGTAGGRNAPHLLRAAQRAFHLNALRLQLAVRRAQQRRDHPLDVEAVSQLAARYPDPFGGAPPVLEGNPGALWVRPPRRLAPAREPPVRHLIRWPLPRRSSSGSRARSRRP